MTFEEVNNYLHSNAPPFDYIWFGIKRGDEKCYLFPSFDNHGNETGEYYLILRNPELSLQCRAKIGVLHDLTERILVEIMVKICIAMKERSEDVQRTSDGGRKVQGEPS